MVVMGDWDKLRAELKAYDKEWNVTFAIWCARKVLPIWEARHPEDRRPALAIQATQNWLDAPSEKNASLACKAAAAVYWTAYRAGHAARIAKTARAASARAADTAWAAYSAALAVYSVDAAYSAADAALNDGESCLDLFEEYKQSLELNTISLYELNAGFSLS